MDRTNDKLLYTALELIKILFYFQTPSVELEKFVVEAEGHPLNEMTSSLMLFYLLSIISIEKTEEFLLPYWPISYEFRSQFRCGIRKFFTWMKRQWPFTDLGYSHSLIKTPHDTKFLLFLVKLSGFATKIIAERIDIDSPDKTESLQESSKFCSRISFTEKKKQLEAECQRNFRLGRMLERENLLLTELIVRNEEILNDLIGSCSSICQESSVVDDWEAIVEGNPKSRPTKVRNIIDTPTYTHPDEWKSPENTFSSPELEGNPKLRPRKSIKDTQNATHHHVWKSDRNTFSPPRLEGNAELRPRKSRKDTQIDTYHHVWKSDRNTYSPPRFGTNPKSRPRKSEVIYRPGCDILNKERHNVNPFSAALVGRYPESRPRKIQNFNETAPFLDDYDEGCFSSEGLTGDQISEEVKNPIRIKQNVVISGQTTPLSRKSSKIPSKVIHIDLQNQEMVKQSLSNSTNDTSKLLSRRSSMIPLIKNDTHKKRANGHQIGTHTSVHSMPLRRIGSRLNKKNSTKPFQDEAMALPSSWSGSALVGHSKSHPNTLPQQKQAKKIFQKAEVVSSPVCSNTSPEEVPVPDLIDFISPPILETQRPSNISNSILETVDYSDFAGNSSAPCISDDEPRTPKIPSWAYCRTNLTRGQSSPSLKAIIERYKKLRKDLKLDEFKYSN